MSVVSATWPGGAATPQRIGKAMDVILHIGAHRCASTSFQHYLRRNSDKLAGNGIGFWGPRYTRKGLFRGLTSEAKTDTRGTANRRGIGRVRLNLSQCEQRYRTLMVSDENVLGSMRENLRSGKLYPNAANRMTRFLPAFDGYVRDVVLNIRSPETYWASVLGYVLMRGGPVPDPDVLDRIARSRRGWREVVKDIADAVPGTRLRILPFEVFAGRPDRQLAAFSPGIPPHRHARSWVNQTPLLPKLRARAQAEQAACLPEGDGRWQPFSREQISMLREQYADDVMWLIAGADGLASMIDTFTKKEPGLSRPATEQTRGRPNDHQERRMEGAG